MSSPVALDVVVCTYNRAPDLDRALAALARQRGADGVAWSVLVVDNASTDDTAAVTAAWEGHVPGLRRVFEAEQGLTPARRRGVRESAAEWIAFVDDDNLLGPGWIAAMAAQIAAHPTAGGFGGRIVPRFGRAAPRFVNGFGFCYAAQDHGSAPCEVDSLAGAGMVLRRSALEACGWLERPLLADRVGRRAVSGGDVEIAQRVRAAGYALRYVPDCVLDNRVQPARETRRYLLEVAHELGVSEALVNALGWPGGYRDWLAQARANARRRRGAALGGLGRAALRRRGLTSALTWLSFAIGVTRGIGAVRAMAPERREALLGAAALRG